MKKYSLLFLLCCFGFALQAQQQKTLIDEPIPAEYLGIDKKIDKGFEPTSNVIQSIVFYSFKINDRRDYTVVQKADAVNYFIETDKASYFKHKANNGSGKISNDAYYIKVADEKEYNKAKGEGKKGLEEQKYKNVPAAKPAYQITTPLSDGSEFSVSYLDNKSCYVSYSETDKEGKTYNVKETIEFGKEYTVKGAAFKVVPAADASLTESTPTYVMKTGAVRLPFVLIILILGALFCTIYFKFPNIRYMRLAYDTVRGKYYDPTGNNVEKAEDDNPDTARVEGTQGEVSPFQALSAALSATVGLGNIAGVAIAITIGGPGATFWMIVAGFLGMAAKFAECTLGVKFREIGPDGTVHGGPMYYLKNGFKEKGLGTIGKALAIFFAIMCVGGSFGGGNMFQVNQAAAQVTAVFGVSGGSANLIFGIITAILVAVVIIGGIKRIASVAEAIVPFMAILYVGAALIIIAVNVTALPETIGLIFSKAISPDAAAGGFIGAMIAGFQRAAFSNEAGVGSAAIAHSAVRTTHAASEGIVALLEPFIDTVIICTMSAMVIIITGNYYNEDGLDGVGLTSKAFASVIPGFEYVLTLAVVLFALSTMLSWSYYGLQAWKYLFGKGKMMDLVYKIIFCVFVVIGATASLGSVVGFSDAMIFAMVFPNVIGVVFLAPVITKEVARYVNDIKEGRIKAVKK
jgi:AGCS family alanine or glycine:cation symporter